MKRARCIEIAMSRYPRALFNIRARLSSLAHPLALSILLCHALPPLDATSAIDRIMLSGADSRKLGYQTRNCIYSRALVEPPPSGPAIARRPRRRRGAIDVVDAVVKSNEAIV